MNDTDRLKRSAAERAVEFVEPGMRLGLGTGSTARHVVDVLAERRASGGLADIVGVPTSRATERYAREKGLPLSTLDDTPRLDLTIDGADEVDPGLELIKGLGGALLWEKIVAQASERLVIVIDESKRVRRLGDRAPLPVEVVPFGWTTHRDLLEILGAEPELRTGEDGDPVLTDGGHYLVDCRFRNGIEHPERLERELRQRTGIVESGLFIGMADAVVAAGTSGVEVLRREGDA